MKIVREILYEKFNDKTDPVHDIGIGGINTGRMRADLKNEYRRNFIKAFDDVLLNKTVTGTFNQMLVAKNDGFKVGKGWGKYTIHIDRISQFDEDSQGLNVFDDTEKASYIIPYDDQKIFVEE